LFGFCLSAAVVDLDTFHIGQWMISRPVVMGPLMGWACGNVLLGAQMGALVELLILAELPLGNAVTLNGAVTISSALLLTCGPHRTDPAVSLPAGFALGELHRLVEKRERSWRNSLTRVAERSVSLGESAPFGRIIAASMGRHVAITALFLFGSVLIAGPALGWGWAQAPAAVRAAFAHAFDWTAWLGAAALLLAFHK